MKTITNYGFAILAGMLLTFIICKDTKYFELIATWLIDMSQQLLPTVHAILYSILGVVCYRWGRGER